MQKLIINIITIALAIFVGACSGDSSGPETQPDAMPDAAPYTCDQVPVWHMPALTFGQDPETGETLVIMSITDWINVDHFRDYAGMYFECHLPARSLCRNLPAWPAGVQPDVSDGYERAQLPQDDWQQIVEWKDAALAWFDCAESCTPDVCYAE